MGRCQRSSFWRVNVSNREHAIRLYLCQLVKYFIAQSVVSLSPTYICINLYALNISNYKKYYYLNIMYYWMLYNCRSLHSHSTYGSNVATCRKVFREFIMNMFKHIVFLGSTYVMHTHYLISPICNDLSERSNFPVHVDARIVYVTMYWNF